MGALPSQGSPWKASESPYVCFPGDAKSYQIVTDMKGILTYSVTRKHGDMTLEEVNQSQKDGLLSSAAGTVT